MLHDQLPFVFVLGLVTIGACLTLHCSFMFMVFMALRSQVGSFEQMADVVSFSGTTSTTPGTGTHVLPPPSCVLARLEATDGILAAGLDTALLFSILSNLARRRSDDEAFSR